MMIRIFILLKKAFSFKINSKICILCKVCLNFRKIFLKTAHPNSENTFYLNKSVLLSKNILYCVLHFFYGVLFNKIISCNPKILLSFIKF
jgi:hypothetical protein